MVAIHIAMRHYCTSAFSCLPTDIQAYSVDGSLTTSRTPSQNSNKYEYPEKESILFTWSSKVGTEACINNSICAEE
jgi:hypothetical protein